MGTLASKIAKASMGLGGKLKADARNKEQNYNYISADKVLSVAGQVLAEVGVACFPAIVRTSMDVIDRGNGKARYDAGVEFAFTLADEDGTMEMPWVGFGSDYSVPDKAIYKAITSGHKYFLMKLLNIGEGNEDGEHDVAQAEKPAQRPAYTSQRNPADSLPDRMEDYGPPLDYDNPFTGNGLSKAAAGFLEKCRTYQTEDPKPCSEAMYRYLVGTMNYATEKDAHTAILSEMVGSPVDGENRPGYTLTKKLLDTLPATKQNKETKENEPNPEHVPAILAAVKEIWKATKAA